MSRYCLAYAEEARLAYGIAPVSIHLDYVTARADKVFRYGARVQGVAEAAVSGALAHNMQIDLKLELKVELVRLNKGKHKTSK